MKLAISGKGGVGKSTLSALLAQVYADQGRGVLAVDADPSPCLAGALGYPDQKRAQLNPISEMNQLIEERTGAKPGTMGGFFTINPRVDDIRDRFSVEHRGVHLLEMGSVDMGGSGCICPESAMLKTLFTHLLFRDEDVLILDMYAGVEHLGRATVDFVDAMIIVVEPTRRSLGTARQIKKLANDMFELLTPIIKSYLANKGYEVCVQAMQVYAGAGYTKDYLVEQYMRDCKIVSIYEGTCGIQAMDLLGRKMVMEG